MWSSRNEADGCQVRFERCEIIRRDEETTHLAPITIEAPRRLDLDVGSIEISDCIVRDTLVRQPVALVASPMTRLRKMTGSLTIQSPSGEEIYTLDAAQLEKWFSSQGLVARISKMVFDWKKTSPVATNIARADEETIFRLRGETAWLVWGQANRPIELVARTGPVGRHTPATGTMTVTTADGQTATRAPEIEDEELVYRLRPRKTGPHRFHWQGNSKTTIRLVRRSSPAAILGESQGVDLIRPNGTLCFCIPAGVKRFAVQIEGQGIAETVNAVIRDAAGHVAKQQDNIGAPHVFVLERKDVTSAEIWSIRLGPASEGVLEDVSIQVLGVPPIFAATPSEVFTAKE